jgi:hypothetical protein
MIHSQKCHKENPIHVCFFVFEMKRETQCQPQIRMKEKKDEKNKKYKKTLNQGLESKLI